MDRPGDLCKALKHAKSGGRSGCRVTLRSFDALAPPCRSHFVEKSTESCKGNKAVGESNRKGGFGERQAKWDRSDAIFSAPRWVRLSPSSCASPRSFGSPRPCARSS